MKGIWLGIAFAVTVWVGGCASDTAEPADAGAAENDTGEGVASPDTFEAPNPVPAPRLVAATPGDSALLVEWSVEPGVVVDAFAVYYRARLPGPPWDGAESLTGESPVVVQGATDVTLAGLDNGVSYYVAVAAVSGDTESPLSTVVHAVPEIAKGSLAFVPAGVFWMGASPKVTDVNEEPLHPVYVDAFWMDKYHTTNAQYRACVDAGACGPPAKTSGFVFGITEVDDYFDNPLYGDLPVVYLENQDAVDYCAWRGMRLPTEAEWEKAARGDDPERLHAWGNEEPACAFANFLDEGVFCVGGPVEPGSFPDNVGPYGHVELAGNVWVWTSDWYDPMYYASSPCANPTGPESGTEKILRGGSWYYDKAALSVTYRNRWTPEFVFTGNTFGDYRGFNVRCVKSASSVPCDPALATCDVPDDAACHALVEEPDVVEAHDADAMAVDIAEPDEIDAEVVEPDAEVEMADAEVVEPDIDVEPDIVECIDPQEAPIDPACFTTVEPDCPSGWPTGCEAKICSCFVGSSTDPGTCGEEGVEVDVGWKDVDDVVHPFAPNDTYEICEGFQGGVHLAAVVEIAADELEGPQAFADVYGKLMIGEYEVGGLQQNDILLKITDEGTYRTNTVQIRFEGCVASAYEGETVELDILIRLPDGRWGKHTVPLSLVDAVDGPYLTPAKKDPC